MHVKKAGAVILSAQNPESVFLLYQAKQQAWSFPKGHVDEGESVETAAIRETLEETGLRVSIIAPLTMMPYHNAIDGDIELEMFLVRSLDDGTYKKEYEGNEFLWVNYRDVAEKLGFENLKTWYQENFDVIETHVSS